MWLLPVMSRNCNLAQILTFWRLGWGRETGREWVGPVAECRETVRWLEWLAKQWRNLWDAPGELVALGNWLHWEREWVNEQMNKVSLQSLVTEYIFKTQAKFCYSGTGHHSNQVKDIWKCGLQPRSQPRLILFCFVFFISWFFFWTSLGSK